MFKFYMMCLSLFVLGTGAVLAAPFSGSEPSVIPQVDVAFVNLSIDEGESVASIPVTLTNNGPELVMPFTVNVRKVWDDGTDGIITWMNATPPSGVLIDASIKLSLNFSTKSLEAGRYAAVVVIDTQGSSVSIPVNLQVLPSGGGPEA